MSNKKNKALYCAICIFSLVIYCLGSILISGKYSFLPTTHAVERHAVKAPFGFRATRYSHTATTLKWNKVKGVNGYKVYSYNTKTKKYKLIKTIKGSNKTKWVRKGLKTNKLYYYGLRAYKKINGKNIYSPYSYRISSKPHNKNAKYVNVTQVATVHKSATLGLGMKKSFATNVYLSKAKIKAKQKFFSKSIRWYSSNSSIAKVDKKGKVTAQSKAGSCYINAVAHNGAYCKLKLKVVNYANPKSFDLGGVGKDIANMLTGKNKENLCEIATYFTIHRPKERIVMSLDDNENFVITNGIDLGAMNDIVKQFLLNQVNSVTVIADKYYVEFIISEYIGVGSGPFGDEEDKYKTYTITYYYEKYMAEEELPDRWTFLAPHWSYVEHMPS